MEKIKNIGMSWWTMNENVNCIEVGLFIFDRGWIESKIILINDLCQIQDFSNTEFFNGVYKRFNFNKELIAFETGLLNLKEFESKEEHNLADLLISYLKETNVFSDEFIKFEITVPEELFNYFENNF